MRGERDEVHGGRRVAILAKGKAMRPAKGLTATFGIADIKPDAATDIVANHRPLRACLLLGYPVRVTKNTIHAQRLGVIARGGDVVKNSMQKERVAQLRAGGRTQAIVGQELGLHRLRRVLDLAKHTPSRIAHHGIARVRQTTKPILVVAQVNVRRLQLAEKAKPGQQIVHDIRRPVWIIRIPPSARAQRGHVRKISKMQTSVRLIRRAEFQHRIQRPPICLMTMSA